jgi:hypothetical protein
MRITLTTLVAAALTLALLPGAAAGDFHFSVGLSAWYVNWSVETSRASIDFDPTIMGGVSLLAGYDKFWATALYHQSGSFERRSLAAERKDLDLLLGYNVYRGLAVIGGYKSWRMTLEREGVKDSEQTLDAAVLGLGWTTLVPRTPLYFNATALVAPAASWTVDYEQYQDLSDSDLLYDLGVGISYRFKTVPLFPSLEYRYQKLERDRPGTDTYQGVRLRISYTFG